LPSPLIYTTFTRAELRPAELGTEPKSVKRRWQVLRLCPELGFDPNSAIAWSNKTAESQINGW